MFIPELDKLDEEKVRQMHEFMAQRLSEYAPSIDKKRGVIRDVVLHLSSVLGQAVAQIIEDKILSSHSLLAIQENPNKADPDMVDKILSNFRVFRRPGRKAEGKVVIVLDKPEPVVIPRFARFHGGGTSFQAKTAFSAVTSASHVVSADDRLIQPMAGGEHFFVIDVVAENEGASGQLKKGTSLSPGIRIPHFVRAYAEDDFTNGADADTNETMLRRMHEGVAGRNVSNRVSISSSIRSEEKFSGVSHISIVGFGDEEQVRYHSIFPLAYGGRVDIYARTDLLPQSKSLVKEAVLVQKTAQGGIWQFSLGKNDAPGFYDVEKIVFEDENDINVSGFSVVDVVKGFVVSDEDWAPDIEKEVEASFSKYQTAVIRFLDNETDTTGMVEGQTKKKYKVFVRFLPQIDELQNFLSSPEVRSVSGDVLVKAPVPCFVSLYFIINKRSADPDIDAEKLRKVVASYVNGLGFVGTLSASSLAHVIHQHLLPHQSIGSIDIDGKLLRPDGTIRRIRSKEAIEIPYEPERMVTKKTVAFFLYPEDIGIGVRMVA